MANTLIIRYHRIGDALIVLPLIVSLATKYKEDTFTILTNERFNTFLEVMPPNVVFKPMISKKSKGVFRGLIFSMKKRLFSAKMRSFASSFDKIAFLQYDIIEQKLHKSILRNNLNIEIALTNENRFFSEERIPNKCNDGLTMIDLHKEALACLGYNGLQPAFNPVIIKNRNSDKLFNKLNINSKKKLIAISPFSKENTKIYPLNKMESIISHLSKKNKYQVLIFGGGTREKRQVDTWIEKYPSVISLIDRISFDEETTVMSKCDIALTMDSANLHLAALLDVPVISIWGATAPQNGYYPANLGRKDALIKDLSCQPCSIFGNKPCTNPKVYDCLDIDPKIVIQRIEDTLSN
ncbi:MAG: glycosyltransferase family 9 protein [Prevotella sp.]|jgi:ADP-heptose:LPS heptosyltransferase|nr:glycosyltransferase family 9 protein [Prevotella sp.]